MAVILLSLILGAIALIYYYFHNINSYWKKRGIPFDQPLPLVGNLKDIGRKMCFHEFNEQYYKKFKGQAPYAGMFFTNWKTAFIMDLDLIKNILIKDFQNFHDRGVFNNVEDDPLTGHLFALDGEQWKAMRNKLTPVFTSGKMKFMFPTVVTVSENLAKACQLHSNGSLDGDIEIKELCARYTTDVIGTCAFGIDCNSLKDPNAEFRQMGRLVLGEPRHSTLVQTFMFVNPELARKFHMKFIRDDVSKFFLDAVRRTVAYRIENGVKRNDFMDLLIELKAENETKAKSGGGIDLTNGLTVEQIAAQAFVFFVAGFDTSSTTMAFCLYELALNLEIQDKLRAEISNAIEAHNGSLTYECVQEMEYLDMVLSETLRKYTILPHLIRKTKADYQVPNSHHIIEKGVTCLIPIAAINRDPDYFPNPMVFDPNRFTHEVIKTRHPAIYLPFGDGPRHCIGMRFGQMQAKVGLISLLTNFKFSVSKNTQVPLTYGKKSILLSAEHGIYLKVEHI